MAVRILVIDDDAAVRKMLSQSIYTKLNCEVHEAAGPAEARSFLGVYSYSLVVTELSFSQGKLQGLNLIEKLAALPSRPWIIAFSVYEIAGPIALSRGADAFATKPVQAAALISVLRDLLGKRELPGLSVPFVEALGKGVGECSFERPRAMFVSALAESKETPV